MSKARIINIYGDNRFDKYTKIREACRGIAVKNGKIVLSYEVNIDRYGIPGGGVETDEAYEACCIREMAEETGLIVKPLRQYLTTNEYYEEYLYISHYFICEVTGQTKINLTAQEKKLGMEPRWIPLEEAVSIFSKHQTYAATHEEKRGSYLREYNALCAYLCEKSNR